MQQYQNFKIFQDWLTIRRDATRDSTDVVQSSDCWLDLGDVESVTLRVELRYVALGTLHIETSASAEGPWKSVWQSNAQTETLVQLVTHPTAVGTTPLYRFVRWKHRGISTGGTATFRILYAIESVASLQPAKTGMPETGTTGTKIGTGATTINSISPAAVRTSVTR